MLSNFKIIHSFLLFFKCLVHLGFTLLFILVFYHTIVAASNQMIPSFAIILMNERESGLVVGTVIAFLGSCIYLLCQ